MSRVLYPPLPAPLHLTYYARVQLSLKERDAIHGALKSAVTGKDDLEVFVSLKLAPRFESVTPAGGLDIMILNVIKWAEAHGKTEDLMQGALDMFKDNTAVKLQIPSLLEDVRRRTQQEVNRASIQQLDTIPDLTAKVSNLEALVKSMQDRLPSIDSDRGRGALEAGKRAVEKLERRGDAASLTPEEQTGLEAIILGLGRPALLIKDGEFATPPPIWNKLEAKRDQIRTAVAAVGRIELVGHPHMKWIGTGFLLSRDVVAIASFMARELGERKRARWTFRPGIRAKINFGYEYGSLAVEHAITDITDIIGVDETVGIALLEVGDTGAAGRKIPAPIPADESPVLTADREVYVVGYASRDTRRPDDFLRDVFGNIFDVKRLCPGRILRVAPPKKDHPYGFSVIEHDCSTSGGMGGAPLIDLETGNAIGLHFAAQHLVAGYACRLDLLRETQLAKDAELWVELE
jgi:endonuclease G, mitochondrial